MPQIPTSDKARGPRSLKRMALAVALRNIASITDVGEMAFADARPILTHIENPHQLHLLETNCPQLAAEPDQMAAVWGRLLTKKVPGWDTKGFLTDEELQTLSWIDVYTTVKAAIDAEMAAAEDRLKQTLAGFSKAKEDNATQLVNNRALIRKIPGVMTKKRGPGGGNAGGQSVLNFGSGSRTKMTTGQSVLRRARREAKEISKVSQLSSRLTENQAVARSQIRKPPAAMINDYRVMHQPGTGIIRPPKRRTAGSSTVTTHYETEGRGGAPGTGLGVGNATNEARLLALKTGGVAAASAAAAAASSYSAGPLAPAIHAPKKRVATSTATTNASSSHKPKEKRRTYDYDDDDELFGVVTQPSKRARLTVEDLEGGGGSGGDDDNDLFGSDEEPRSKSKPKPKSRPTISSPPSRVPDRNRSSAVSSRDSGRERERDSGRDRDRPRTERREDRSNNPPKKPSARPSAPIASTAYRPPPAQTAGSPLRGQAVGGGGAMRKKAVDIFMRPKKR